MGIIQINYLCLKAQQIIIILLRNEKFWMQICFSSGQGSSWDKGDICVLAHSPVGVGSAHGRERPKGASIAGGSSCPRLEGWLSWASGRWALECPVEQREGSHVLKSGRPEFKPALPLVCYVIHLSSQPFIHPCIHPFIR